MRWGVPRPPQFGSAPVTKIRNLKRAELLPEAIDVGFGVVAQAIPFIGPTPMCQGFTQFP